MSRRTMVINEFEDRLLKLLQPYFMPLDFQSIPEKRQFRKTLPNGDFKNIIFSVSPYEGNEYWVEINFGVRKANVENIVGQFLQLPPDFQHDTTTWVTSIGRFRGQKYFRYKIKSGEEMQAAAADIIDFFETAGLSFMRKHLSLENIDLLFNKEPKKVCPFIYNQTARCFRGLIVSRLIDSDNFHDLADTYRFEVLKLGNDEEIEEYERLLALLLYYSPN